MASSVFDAQIKAVDAATGPIRAIVKGMRDIIASAKGVGTASKTASDAAGKAGKDAAKAIQTASHTAEQAHLRYFSTMGAHVRLLRGHFGSLNTSIGAVSSSFTKFLPMLGALGAGASLTGLFMLTKSTADAAIATQALTLKLGISAREFGGLAWAAKASGVETDSMINGLEKLNKTLGAAVAGKGKDAAALFAHLGIAMKDASGHTRTTAQLMPELADAFAKTTDPAMRALMATTLFGKQGQELLPVLMKGRDALEKFAEEGKTFGYFATPEQKAALISFGHTWEELEASISGFKKEIASNLAPVLQPVIAAVRDWVQANRHWIATAIADKVRALVTAIGQLDLGSIITQTTEWVKWTYQLIENHGGLTTVLGALALFMASPMINAVTGVIGVFTTLGSVLKGLAVLAWANPITAAISAIALGAFLIYENWDWVKTQMNAIFQWFSKQDGWVQTLLTIVAPFIFLPMKIIENWGPIKAFFGTLWEGITSVFTSSWDAITAVLGPFISAVPKKISEAWEPIKAFFVGMWETITAAFDNAWNKIKPIVDSLKGAAEFVKGSWLGRTVSATAAAVGRTAVAASTAFTMPGAFGNDNMPPPGLYGRGDSAAPPAAPQQGQVNVKIDLTGAPAGTRVTGTGTGIAQPPDTNVGYANPLAFGY